MVARKRDDVLQQTSTATKAISKIKKTDEKRKEKTEKKGDRGIIMLEHVPHGFYENEMRSYFQQYGKVLRVKVARSKKTGKSRGYAYVEFEFEEVAKIAAESMNNYLMFERLIKCKLLEPGQNASKIFADRYIREDNYPTLKARNAVKELQDTVTTAEEQKEKLVSRVNKLKKQNTKLIKLGINYEFVPKKLMKLRGQKNAKEAGAEKSNGNVVAATAKAMENKSLESKTSLRGKSKSPVGKVLTSPLAQSKQDPGGNNGINNVKKVSPKKARLALNSVDGQKLLSTGKNKRKSQRNSAQTSSTGIEDASSVSFESPVKTPKGKKKPPQSPKSVNASMNDSMSSPISSDASVKIQAKKKSVKKTAKSGSPSSQKKLSPTGGTPVKSPKQKGIPKSPKSPSTSVNEIVTPFSDEITAVTRKQKKSVTKSPASLSAGVDEIVLKSSASKSPKTPKQISKSPLAKKAAVDTPALSPSAKTPKQNGTANNTPHSLSGGGKTKKAKLGKRKSDNQSSEVPNKSPKAEQQSPIVSAADEMLELTDESPKIKIPKAGRKSLQLPKVSPKMLRSKLRQSESSILPTPKKGKSPKTKPVKKIAEVPEVPAEPPKNKFSPKLLRSRKGIKEAATQIDPVQSPKLVSKSKLKAESQTPKEVTPKSKFSPKLLRSKAQRHSEDLSGKDKPMAKQMKGRKSMR